MDVKTRSSVIPEKSSYTAILKLLSSNLFLRNRHTPDTLTLSLYLTTTNPTVHKTASSHSVYKQGLRKGSNCLVQMKVKQRSRWQMTESVPRRPEGRLQKQPSICFTLSPATQTPHIPNHTIYAFGSVRYILTQI